MFSKILRILAPTLCIFPLLKYFPFVSWIIKKSLIHCENIHFTGKFSFLKGNIYAKNAYLGGTFFQDLGNIHIGEGTIFGYENMILTAGYKDTYSLLDKLSIKDVIIGKNVWITSRVIILGGSTIGDHSIIGAGSVVTGDIPSHCFAAGNPCKVIKYLDKK